MAKLSSVSIGVTVSGDGVNTTYNPPGDPATNPAAPSSGPSPVSIASGENTITVPLGALGVVITPPAASSQRKTIYVTTGEAGIDIHPSRPTYLAIPLTVTAFIINNITGVTETVDLFWV